MAREASGRKFESAKFKLREEDLPSAECSMSQGLRSEYERRLGEAAFRGNRVPALQGKFRVSSMASSIATGYNYYSSAFVHRHLMVL